MKKKNKVLFVIQKFVENKWMPFTLYSTYVHENVARDIMNNMRESNPMTRYRIAIMRNNEMINAIY